MREEPKERALLLGVKLNDGEDFVRSMEELANLAVACDMDGESLWNSDLSGPVVLVLGSEGSGISPLLKKHCDLVVSIPMVANEVGSLNVSNAAAVILCEVAHQRQGWV